MIEQAPTPVGPFCHATEADGWIFLTGQMPTDPKEADAPLPEGIDFTDLPNNYGKYQGTSSNHHKVVNEIVKDLSGDKCDIVEGTEGIKSIAAIKKIYQSAGYEY